MAVVFMNIKYWYSALTLDAFDGFSKIKREREREKEKYVEYNNVMVSLYL